MDSEVLLDAFKDKLGKKRKVRFIPTYEGAPASPKSKKAKPLDKEVLEDLKSLGYIK